MILWGKLLGAILGWVLLGTWWGVLGGMVLGHVPDWLLGKLRQRPAPVPRMAADKTAFTGTFAVMGCLAHADGRISGRELEVLESVMAAMDLDESQREEALAAFEAGQQRDFNHAHQTWLLQRRLRRRPRLLLRFVLLQMEMVWADGPPTTDQQAQLELVARRVGYSHARLMDLQDSMRADGISVRPPSRSDIGEAYELLGVEQHADQADIKQAYRRMISRHHPDRLVSQGKEQDEVEQATDFTRRIRNAYELIRTARGFDG